MLCGNSASSMAFFSSGSRALVEILTGLQRKVVCVQSVERPMPVDHTLFEFGSIRYHLQASITDSENIYLSISTPSLSYEASPSSGLPEITLQETRKMYHKFAEIIEPAKEGYTLTLRLNFSGLTRPKDRTKAINQISLLQSVILSSQLKDMLASLGSSGTMKLVYNQRDPFFVSKTPVKISAIFPMRFRDDTDLAIASSFFQELQDLGSTSSSRAPRCSWSPIPPPELRGEYVHHLTTNGGFVSFDILARHVKGRRAARTAWILLNFQSYVKYHIKCTRSYIQSRMRKRLEIMTEVIDDAKFRGNDESRKKLQVRKRSKRRSIKFARAKKLQKGFKAVIDKIKRLRLRIRVKGLDRFRRHCQCFPVLKLTMAQRKEQKYQKLE
ncbi:actin-related protein 2/3 complex subunit 2B-like isoform X1 [Oryza glaberrima]|uniref:actin-related protein 2/3 complex subunit 2B-like isoform X1 n=1 Tax=Oryza glaberrima TaxID=4538 RepID=UPI00224C26FD|nr:actin-related protein 2/3 complex subunit 2B-like isoform X1 [Oryza glaberrima]